jgi:hypothetical protein
MNILIERLENITSPEYIGLYELLTDIYANSVKNDIIDYICRKTSEQFGNECDNEDALVNNSIPLYDLYQFDENNRLFLQLLYGYIYFGYYPGFLNESQIDVLDLSLEYFMWVSMSEDFIPRGQEIYISYNFRVYGRNEEKEYQSDDYNTLISNDNFEVFFNKIKGTHIDVFIFSNNSVKKIYNYICEKSKQKLGNINCNQQNYLEYTDKNKLRMLISSYLYYGYSPNLLTGEQQNDMGFYQFYFLWQKEDDPNKLDIPRNLEISNRNFNQYMYWTNKQLNAYYFANILPNLLRLSDIKININNPIYKNILIIDEPYFNILINNFINNQDREVLSEQNINAIKNNKVGSGSYINKFIMESFIQVKKIKKEIRDSLDIKLRKIVSSKDKKRFKWQNLCSPKKLNELEIDELHELAIIEKIPYYLMMTKNELCVEFAKRFENVIDGKKKVEPMCINTTSILGTELNDIPPEFFFSYQHNQKVYCDDIRDLHKHFQLNGNKHPIDRSIMKERVVDKINKWYNYLTKNTNNMLDFDDEPVVLSMQSQLSSKFAGLASKLNYPNSSLLFINSNETTYNKFVSELRNEGILNNNEIENLSIYTDLNQNKLVLIDFLLLKIMNDPQRIQVPGQQQLLSAIAINLSNIYNTVFN